MNDKYTLACYYFPNYHPEPRNVPWRAPGWTEWDLVKNAVPRYPDHYQPQIPAWGYTDESDPGDMARSIDAAAGHGIDAFIFDWYWYDEKPYLHRALEKGFFDAANHERMQFAIMWANHDWTDCFPYERNGYPYCQILVNNTPAAFEQLLESARRHLDAQHHGQRILTINAWNEWTEGSYLEPDTMHGMGYLNAIKKVFGQ